MIRFDDNSKLKAAETFGIDGSLVDLTLVKSRTNKAGQFCTLVFDQDNGFDAELSLFILLKEHGKINGAGAYLYIGDRNDMKFSQKTFKDKLFADIELQQVFMQEVSIVLRDILKRDEESKYFNEFDISSRILNEINMIAA